MIDLDKLKSFADGIETHDHLLDKSVILRVVGVSFDGRQDIVSKLTKETEIKIRRDKRNKYDYYAVEVLALIENNWQQIGFLPKHAAKKYAEFMDTGQEFISTIHNLKGGQTTENGNKLAFGLDVTISKK